MPFPSLALHLSALFFAALLVTGCATSQPGVNTAASASSTTSSIAPAKAPIKSPNRFFIAPEVTLPLPPVACDTPDTAPESTLLTFAYGGKKNSLLVVSRCRGGVLAMDGLLPTGIALFTLTWDGNAVKAEAKLPVKGAPDPQQVLGDYLLAHLPLTAWQPLLPSGMSLTEPNTTTRVLADQEGAVETIRYTPIGAKRTPTQVEQHRFGYTLTLTPITEGVEGNDQK